MPMMVPVRMPGIARGRTVKNHLQGRGAKPVAPSRMEGGTDLSAARAAMMIVGSVIKASTMPPTRGDERSMPKIDEHPQAQQTEDDGRHCRQVVDVDLDDLGWFVLRRELFQVGGGAHGDRRKGAKSRTWSTWTRSAPPGYRPVPARGNRRRKESNVEGRPDRDPIAQTLEPFDFQILCRRSASGRPASICPLLNWSMSSEADPHPNPPANNAGVGEYGVSDIEGRARVTKW